MTINQQIIKAAEEIACYVDIRDLDRDSLVNAYASVIAKYLGHEKAILAALSDEERIALFSDYCRECGSSSDPSCQCWNDE